MEKTSNELTNKNDEYFKNKLTDSLHIFSKQLNHIFNDVNKVISDMIFKTTKKYSRNNKLTFNDAILYLFNYCSINKTKLNVVSNLNYNNDINVHPSNYQKKEAKIPLLFYENLFNNIQSLFYEKYSINDLNKNRIVCVDGTYNNTNLLNDSSLETSLNMGYYDFTNKIPVNIKLKGMEGKNREIKSFIDDIKNKDVSTNNVIFVFDRAYDSYDLFNYMDDNNYKYVCRIKKSCLYLDKEKNKDKISKKKNKIKNENVRFILSEHKYELSIKNKKNKKITFDKISKCYLITNLNSNEYDDEKVKKIYLNRWSVESFFKLLKSNYRFSNLTNHTYTNTKTQYHKQNYIILIQYYIIRIIDIIYTSNINDLNNHKFNKKNKNKYTVKHNNKNMILGLELILKEIIDGNVNSNSLYKYSTYYIKKINIQIEIYKPRICKNPSYKWYLKSYAEYYKYNVVIEAIINNNVDSLNKNLKLLASEIRIK
jgi:hypothetical protein